MSAIICVMLGVMPMLIAAAQSHQHSFEGVFGGTSGLSNQLATSSAVSRSRSPSVGSSRSIPRQDGLQEYEKQRRQAVQRGIESTLDDQDGRDATKCCDASCSSNAGILSPNAIEPPREHGIFKQLPRESEQPQHFPKTRVDELDGPLASLGLRT